MGPHSSEDEPGEVARVSALEGPDTLKPMSRAPPGSLSSPSTRTDKGSRHHTPIYLQTHTTNLSRGRSEINLSPRGMLSPKVLLSPSEIKRRHEEAVERARDQQAEAEEARRQRKALEEVSLRLAKERAALAAKEEALEMVERAKREQEENRLQAEQVDVVMRKMQERAIRKASLTPVKSPRSSAVSPNFRPVVLHLEGSPMLQPLPGGVPTHSEPGATGRESPGEKRKMHKESPERPEPKRCLSPPEAHVGNKV